MDSLFTFTSSMVPPKNFSQILSESSSAPTFKVLPKPDLIPGIPDGILALIAPIVAYWTYASIFHIIDVYELAEKYRIHPSAEEEARNKVSLPSVIQDVVIQHCIQTVIGYIFYKFDPPPKTGHELYAMWKIKNDYSFLPDMVVYYGYMYGISALKMALASVIIDTWQYSLHKLMHVNRTLYRRFHSRHHRLYVPYAYGALYNDPIEGFLLDTLGTGVAAFFSALTPREAIILYTFATMKTVDDHCGYRLPYDIFQIVFPNNSIYHDIHHQSWGIKHNFSQPFFTMWDYFFGTQYQFAEEYKQHQNKITLEKYKEFLATKERKLKQVKENKKDI